MQIYFSVLIKCTASIPLVEMISYIFLKWILVFFLQSNKEICKSKPKNYKVEQCFRTYKVCAKLSQWFVIFLQGQHHACVNKVANYDSIYDP